MAYPIVNAPYGLKPINLIGGQPYAGSTRMFPIKSGYSTGNGGIFYGDLVQVTNNVGSEGSVIISTLSNQAIVPTTPGGGAGEAPAGQVGVFMGCTFTNPVTKQKTFSQYYPDGTTANDILAYVVDDPDAIFKAVVCNVAGAGNTVVTGIENIYLGFNISLIQNIGSTDTGDSAIALDGNDINTSPRPMRIVGFVGETAVADVGAAGYPGGQVYPEVLVKFNFGYHSYYNNIGPV